jgi:hypothetical protein
MAGLRMSAMNVGPLSCAKNLLVAFAPGNVDVSFSETRSATRYDPMPGPARFIARTTIATFAS